MCISKREKLLETFLFYFVIALFCLFLACLSTNYDYDFFARLIVGERFIEHGILPFKDFLSYTPTHTWYDHEWGSGVIFYYVLKILGPLGIILLQSILMFLTTVFVVKTQNLQKHPFPRSLLFISVFLVLFSRLNPELIRCQMFSFFFFSLFLYILEKTRKYPKSNLFWWIIPLTVLWNNLHGGIVSGLGLVFIYFIGAILEKRPWAKYFVTLALATPALVINPYGYKYLNFLLSATTKHRKYVVEWWPFYAERHFLYYLPSSGFIIFGNLLNFFNKKIDITKTITLLVTLYLGLAHVKLLSLALIAVGSLCYNEIFKLFLSLKKYLKVVERCLYIVIIVLAMLIPLFSPTCPRAGKDRFPLAEVEFLKINDIEGNILVPFGFGSYVSYKLYPTNLIYMDGRYEEVYNDKEFLYMRDFELAEENWDDILKKYPTEILMVVPSSPVYSVLINNKEWKEIFLGPICAIFIKDKKVKNYYLQPNKNIDYYKKTIFEHRSFK